MLINSAMNEGLAGMQQSQKKLLQTAQDIARAGLPTDKPVPNPTATGAAPRSNAGTAVDDLSAANTVEAVEADVRSVSTYRANQGDVTGALIEQTRQQLIFDASANVVSAANDTLGRLIDDLS
jgi:hypothetical protein